MGGTRAGYKLGFTSAPMRQQMGVDHPNSGVLLAAMRIDGPDLPAGELIQPRVEPEIAIRLGRDLRGADVTPDEVADATAAVLPAIEVVDSRWCCAATRHAPRRTCVLQRSFRPRRPSAGAARRARRVRWCRGPSHSWVSSGASERRGSLLRSP